MRRQESRIKQLVRYASSNVNKNDATPLMTLRPDLGDGVGEQPHSKAASLGSGGTRNAQRTTHNGKTINIKHDMCY